MTTRSRQALRVRPAGGLIGRVLLALLLGVAMPAAAQDETQRPGEDACQADIHRLCDRFFPDAKLVAGCLVDRRAELSSDCAELLAHPPGAGETPAPQTAPSQATPR